MENLMTTAQIAQRLGITRQAVLWNVARAGGGIGRKIGRYRMFNESDYRELCKRRRPGREKGVKA